MATMAPTFRVHQLIAPSTSAVTTARSASLDCAGADFATVIVNPSPEANTNATGFVISVLHSDDTVVTNHVTVTANRTEEHTTNHAVVYHLPVSKRYLRLTLTPDTNGATVTHDNVVLSAIAALSGLENRPVSTSGMVGSTNDACVVVS